DNRALPPGPAGRRGATRLVVVSTRTSRANGWCSRRRSVLVAPTVNNLARGCFAARQRTTPGEHLFRTYGRPGPLIPGQQRYWDGNRWTEHNAPLDPPPPPIPRQPRERFRFTRRWVIALVI